MIQASRHRVTAEPLEADSGGLQERTEVTVGVREAESRFLRSRGGRTFEEAPGAREPGHLGHGKWKRAVAKIVASLSAVLTPDDVGLGRGNVRRLRVPTYGACRVPSDSALRGGLVLWSEGDALADPTNGKEAACRGRAGSR